MPELPEVETIARQLSPLLGNRKIKKLLIHDQKLAELDKSRIEGCKISDVYRLGKQVVIELAGKGQTNYLCVHLRMTGRLLHFNKLEADKKHVRVTFNLDKGFLCFQDVRRFGTIKLINNIEDAKPIGVEPLLAGFNSKQLFAMLKDSRQEIKPWLLRQDKLVGLGNIYVSEILFAAKIHPQAIAGALGYTDVKLMFKVTRNILRKAIKNCGTTFSDFQNAKGEIGSYQKFLKVYNRVGEPCKVCGTNIERLVQQQRSGFFCPKCQTGEK